MTEGMKKVAETAAWVLLILVGLALAFYAYGGEYQKQSADCCRDLGVVQLGVTDALNQKDLLSMQKKLVDAMKDVGFTCELTEKGWRCR